LSSENWGGDFGDWQGGSTITKCPENSTLIGDRCFCNEGYVASGDICITYTQNCQNQYGLYSYGDKNYCYCKSGYEWNSSKTTCVKSTTCPKNSTKIGDSCICNEGYVMRNNECITHTEDCVQQFGPNVYGIKGDVGNSSCYCKEGYEWNISQTACIKSIVCPQNSSKITGECICNDGYDWDFSGRVCIRKVEEKISLIEEEQYSQKKEETEEEKSPQLEEKEKPEIVFEGASQEETDKEISVTKEGPKEEKIVIDKGQESEGALKSITTFLASILDIIKNTFSKIFSWF